MKQKKISATKIKPSLIIGEDIKISTRNIKSNKKPLKKSEDCDQLFKEFITHDTTDIYLNEDYAGVICNDIISSDFLDNKDIDEKLLPFIILKSENSHINAKRVLIYSTNEKLLKLEKLINKSGRHEATEYDVKSLSICGIYQEEDNIFNSNIIDNLRIAKTTIEPSDGYYTIDAVK